MAKLRVIDRAGALHELDTVEGWRVMEILRDHKVGIDGLCGGACSCGTCHVVVDADWTGRLHPARDEEVAALDELPVVEDGSRLSCQIIWDDSLDGLTVRLAEAA